MSTPLGAEELQPRPWIARLLGVVPSSTHKMDLPVVEGGGRGRPALFLPSACVAHRLRQVEGRAGGVGDLDPAQERALKDRAQGRLAEQLHRRREGDLLEREDVRRTWSNIVIAIRSALLRLPSSVASQLAAAKSAEQIEALLRAEVRAILTELSGWQPPADTLTPPGPTLRRQRSK